MNDATQQVDDLIEIGSRLHRDRFNALGFQTTLHCR